MKKKINYREILEGILEEKSEEIEKLLSRNMKNGPPKITSGDSFREKLEKQRSKETPESINDAIAFTPMTTIIGIDQKTRKPIYLESSLGDAIQYG